ncbi:dicarboxylate/amino acid:cation symporter [Nesterenkonia xinjiangensis]|uniref:Na+/H+-dicarboxylate symporter n=1 Tax=Nesterenkonia xinjiangensis TaxID=225327 RepID=A0A7Z0GKH4_9MICC|nr:dicarboxylate/amino acid:cation symporter [Nesterenkonia xinjiangensis]NYJ77079.1 Na+/H+-dicarboxylate symporter [Nesterenkonia xinjiangensis]
MSTTADTAETTPTRRLPAWMTSFGNQILAALVLGLGVGFLARGMGGTEEDPNWLTATVTEVGGVYVSLLTAAVVPLVFTAVVTSIAQLRQVTNAARLAGQTLLWFAITAFISVLIGIAIGVIGQPGQHTDVTAESAAEPGSQGSWIGFLESIVPANFMGLTADSSMGEDGALTTDLTFNVLQVLVISIAIGIAAMLIGKKAEPFLNLTSSVLAIIQKVLWWIIRLAPIGTLALIARAVATYGWDALSSLGVFVLCMYVGLAIVFFLVYPLLVRANGLSAKQYFTGVWPAVQLGFVSRSSVGTMPLTQRVTERSLGVPRSYASFAVPLGAVTKMDGCAALYPAIAALFVAQFFGLDLTITQYVLIVFVSVIGSAATAGTTGATVMLTLTLSTLGLPLEGVGLLLAVEPIVDMGRTALNVAGQALVPTIVAKREGLIDMELYSARRTGVPFDDDTEDEEADDTTDLPSSDGDTDVGPEARQSAR